MTFDSAAERDRRGMRNPEAERNAIVSALIGSLGWLPLSIRYKAADAAIAVIDEWLDAGKPLSRIEALLAPNDSEIPERTDDQ